jgi:hypothetical protein
LHPTDKFPVFYELVKQALTLVEGNFTHWNNHVKKVFSQKRVEKLFEEIFFISNSYAFLKQVLFMAISRMESEIEGFNEELLKNVW